MACYRRSKLLIDAFRGFTSKISAKPSIQYSTSRNTLSGYSILASNTAAKFTSSYSIIPPKLVSQGLTRTQYGARRYYYVDRYQVSHFRPRGPRRWFQNPRNVLIVVLLGSGIVITVYFGNLETIPYTKRTHFVLLSKEMERKLGETQFEQMKDAFRGKILPAIHPESVRVRLISNEIIKALQRGLRHEKVWSDLGYASESVGPGVEGSGHETLMALKEFGGEEQVEGRWSREDEILDDKWVQQSRKKGQEKGVRSATSHLDGLNWEVLVVDEPVVNAFCMPGGKIVVFTGLLKHFRSDAEIATIIGHEVGHAVARHSAEGITKNLWFAILQLILYQFVMPDLVNTMSTLFLKLPFSRRMEMEADYIGLLLIASAGYDPRVAPQVYEKLGRVAGGDSALRDYLSTHPSGKKRAQLLAQAKVMEEALHIYRDERAGRGIEGFNVENDEVVTVQSGQKNKQSICDLSSRKWIYDQSYPLYDSNCSYLTTVMTCQKNGKRDSDYEKWRWKPHGCSIRRFDALKYLAKRRKKRTMLVGDSVMTNQWESLFCLEQGVVPTGRKTVTYNGPCMAFHALDYETLSSRGSGPGRFEKRT